MLDVFFFNDTATTEIYTLSLHDALPICMPWGHPMTPCGDIRILPPCLFLATLKGHPDARAPEGSTEASLDRKSTRLNSSHANISYAVFCLKKKKKSSTPSLPSVVYLIFL